MHRYKIVDTDPSWYRETYVDASDWESAQEKYIDRCEAEGVVLGTLRITRAR